ncbi:hypothetical protein E1B28_002104 [Marasmius oreades]|uniref:Uncharacterized protein n=1 Tax=Marasmius oreades TaxID=181124 RepID=A0A9P7RME7_9AGAR|nr:uncharacterized protein E1B28_002104 [Marasmius oreades]KAG7086145.1 hypothetical protein E1B28_002104 [Marasmius oreades]
MLLHILTFISALQQHPSSSLDEFYGGGDSPEFALGMSTISSSTKGKGRTLPPAAPKNIYLQGLESKLHDLHTWVLQIQMNASSLENYGFPQIQKEFQEFSSKLGDIHHAIVRFEGEDWMLPAVAMLVHISFMSHDYSFEHDDWRYLPHFINKFFALHGPSSQAQLPVAASLAPPSPLSTSRAVPALGSSQVASLVSGLPRTTGLSSSGPGLPAPFSSKRKARDPPSSSTSQLQPKKLKPTLKFIEILDSNSEDEEAPVNFYLTRSRAREVLPLVEAPFIDETVASPATRSSKPSVKKIVEKEVPRAQLDVGRLWVKHRAASATAGQG